MDLLEIGVNVVDWIGLAQDRCRWRALVNAIVFHKCWETTECLQNVWLLEWYSAPKR
jgi:hypothetical protein